MNAISMSKSRIKNESAMMATLLRSVPAAATAVFLLAVITMNFLSRITLVSLPWLALNAGILVSWLSFLYLDVVTKHYGARAANALSFLAIGANLLCCVVCFVISRIWHRPGLDMFLGGQWSILLASTLAFAVSALTNNYTNIFIGRRFTANPDGKTAYAVRSFVSTFLSQILDNFLFVFLAFVVFSRIPGAFPVQWTVNQCIGCSVLCAAFELLSEVIFSPLGYLVIQKWKRNDVGRDYIEKYCPNGVLKG